MCEGILGGWGKVEQRTTRLNRLKTGWRRRGIKKWTHAGEEPVCESRLRGGGGDGRHRRQGLFGTLGEETCH